MRYLLTRAAAGFAGGTNELSRSGGLPPSCTEALVGMSAGVTAGSTAALLDMTTGLAAAR